MRAATEDSTLAKLASSWHEYVILFPLYCINALSLSQNVLSNALLLLPEFHSPFKIDVLHSFPFFPVILFILTLKGQTLHVQISVLSLIINMTH